MPSREKQSELTRLGHEIAASAAEITIESCCLPDPAEPNVPACWYNIELGLEGDEKADVAMAVRYLELLGLLQRHASNPDLVCVISPESEAMLDFEGSRFQGKLRNSIDDLSFPWSACEGRGCHSMFAIGEGSAMDTNNYYHALCQFNEGAKQMRAAMEVFDGFERFKGDEDKACEGYRIDLELLRSCLNDLVLDCVRDLENDNMDMSLRLRRKYQAKLRLSDSVARAQDEAAKSDDSEAEDDRHRSAPEELEPEPILKNIEPNLGTGAQIGALIYDNHEFTGKVIQQLRVFQGDGTTYVAIDFDDKTTVQLAVDTRALVRLSVLQEEDGNGDLEEIARSERIAVPET